MLEQIATPWPEMPSGIAVTAGGRIFLSFPRWLDRRAFTVAELVAGKLIPYPSLTANTIDIFDATNRLFSVQSVVATADTLWLLDSGRPVYLPAIPGAAKLVEVDLETGKTLRTVVIPPAATRTRTYLNDVRFDFSRGEAGTAYITDSGTLLSPCAIIVVDLATGRKLRRLEGHYSVQPRWDAVPVIEGKSLCYRLPLAPIGVPYQNGVDGIALDPHGDYVFYCPLNTRVLYRVDAKLMADPKASDADILASVTDMGVKPISDGLESDERGVLYTGDLENKRVMYKVGPGEWQVLVADARLSWIDSLCVAGDFLYLTINQISRMAPFQYGIDRRVPPYRVCRVPLPQHSPASL